MREIKFRFWDKVCNQYVTDESKMYANGTVAINGVWATDDLVIEQFTGLYDRNSKEIWEGDLILSSNGYKHMDETSPVEWTGKGWKIGSGDSYNDGTTTHHTVIGNIHEDTNNA